MSSYSGKNYRNNNNRSNYNKSYRPNTYGLRNLKDILKIINTGNNSHIPSNYGNTQAKLEQLIDVLYKQFIKVVYNDEDDRVLFTAVKGNKGADMNGVASQLNGIILDLRTSKFICVPPMDVHDKFTKTELTKIGANEYDIYKANDGTLVNVYFYNNKWCIGTNKGICVNDKVWNGVRYETALKNIFDKFKIDLTKFKKNSTYSFIMQHPKFHPFTNEENLMLVSMVNNDAFNRNLDNNLRKPFTKSPIPDIKCQEKVNLQFSDIKDINAKSISTFLNGGEKNFGFILRLKNNNKPGYDIFLCSKLLKYIIDNLYAPKVDLSYDRLKYLNILNYVKKDKLFVKLIPHLQDEFKKIDEQIDNLVERIANKDKKIRELEYSINRNIMFRDSKCIKYKDKIKKLLLNDKNVELIYKYL